MRKMETGKRLPTVKLTPRQRKRNRKRLRATIAVCIAHYNSLAVQFRRHHPTGGRKIRLS